MDNSKIKAQVSVEFAVAFVLLAIFAVLATRMFVWLGATLVSRHQAYENSRSMTHAGSPKDMVPPVEFYTSATGKKPMDIFNETK
jgi:hypothetical protein